MLLLRILVAHHGVNNALLQQPSDVRPRFGPVVQNIPQSPRPLRQIFLTRTQRVHILHSLSYPVLFIREHRRVAAAPDLLFAELKLFDLIETIKTV